MAQRSIPSSDLSTLPPPTNNIMPSKKKITHTHCWWSLTFRQKKQTETEQIIKSTGGGVSGRNTNPAVWESTSTEEFKLSKPNYLFGGFFSPSVASCSNFIGLRGAEQRRSRLPTGRGKCTFFCLFAANMHNTVRQKQTACPAAP